jgi:ankyrin repeat protein
MTKRTWSADRELELACKVGSLPDVERCLAEGADPDFEGGTPLFVAILRGHRAVIERLVAAGASPRPFVRKSRLAKLRTPAQVVAALMECVPPPPPEEDPGLPPGDDD